LSASSGVALPLCTTRGKQWGEHTLTGAGLAGLGRPGSEPLN